jgi:hypothetical protein
MSAYRAVQADMCGAQALATWRRLGYNNPSSQALAIHRNVTPRPARCYPLWVMSGLLRREGHVRLTSESGHQAASRNVR